MALGVWSWIGFEVGAVYGEEARNPRRAVPVAIFAVVAFLTLLYTWTAYSATIGNGWHFAVSQFGNLINNSTPYYPLASTYVGGFLQALMIIAISTSGLAFHNGIVRYLYTMGSEHILGQTFGRTHPSYRSPHIAIIAQSLLSALLIIFFAFVIQKTNADGTVSYALGIADGKAYMQTDDIYPYTWLAIIGTIAFMVVYIMVNIASPVFALRFERKSINWLSFVFTHILAPLLSSLVLLIPLISFIMPTIPGSVGGYFTSLGFAATPFPLNILPLFVIGWIVIGLVYSIYLANTNPERYKKMGRIVRGDI